MHAEERKLYQMKKILNKISIHPIKSLCMRERDDNENFIIHVIASGEK